MNGLFMKRMMVQCRKTKAASWSIEHQIELRDLFRKIKEEQVENIGSLRRKYDLLFLAIDRIG